MSTQARRDGSSLPWSFVCDMERKRRLLSCRALSRSVSNHPSHCGFRQRRLRLHLLLRPPRPRHLTDPRVLRPDEAVYADLRGRQKYWRGAAGGSSRSTIFGQRQGTRGLERHHLARGDCGGTCTACGDVMSQSCVGEETAEQSCGKFE